MNCKHKNWSAGAWFFLCACISWANAQSPSVAKVEPPSWWAGHTINPVRVLVRGENLRGARVASNNPALRADNVRVTDKGAYLFVDVTIKPNTKPGDYKLDIITANGKTSAPFAVNTPLDAKTNFQGVTNDDVLYLIMPDRFANGDTANDKDVDRANPRMWHGGDLRGVINKLPYLKELGVTALWLTPWCDNWNGITNCDKPWCPMSSYHGYGAVDYYGVEDHFGTLADVQELVREAHKLGLKIVQDQVANHVGVNHPWLKNPPLPNWFTPFAQNTFNNSVLLSPNGSQFERDKVLKGWFDFSLPDLNQEELEVAKYEIQNALWWIGVTGIDGIRQDTIQYMPRPFIRDWSRAILRQYPKFYMVGEVFERDAAHTAFFQGGRAGWDGVDTALPSVFDFKLWETSQQVFTGQKPMRALRDALKYDGLYPNINRVTTLQNNHDTDRFMSLPGATKEGAKLHLAFMLATRGIPQLYAGEEILMTGGHDPDNRKDFPGGWPDDKRNAFTKEGRATDEQEMFEWTRQWLKLRQRHESLKHGRTVDLSYDEDVYVFAREHKCGISVLAFNRSDKARKISIPFTSWKIDTAACLIPSLEEDFRPIPICAEPDKGNFELVLGAKSARPFVLLQESVPADCGKN
jgi:glycosidase